jgi:predicted negative regulator of RcsB-dependent stress response
MAYSQNALGYNHEALITINKSIDSGYEDPDAYRIRGYILYELSDKKAACSDWQYAAENGLELAEELLNENCRSVISIVK